MFAENCDFVEVKGFVLFFLRGINLLWFIWDQRVMVYGRRVRCGLRGTSELWFTVDVRVLVYGGRACYGLRGSSVLRPVLNIL